MKWRLLGTWGTAAAAAVAVGSCTATPQNCRLNYTATGAAVGAVAGAGVGAGIAAASGASGGGIAAAAAGGAVVGGLLGAVAGRQQDQACRQLALNQAMDRAMALNEARGYRPRRASTSGGSAAPQPAPSGPPPRYQSVEWANEATASSGKIQPLAPADSGDQVCMTYYDQQSSSSATQATTGKACRGSDGQWRPAA
jgi:17 kDa outer membrane surface antigen